MRTMFAAPRKTQCSVLFLITALAVLAALVVPPLAHAFGGIGDDFQAQYPGSNSYANASCRLCHGPSSNSTWNEYGWGLRGNGQNFAALEGDPSININGDTTMLDEINSSTQPGWTTDANNNLYDSGGLTSSTQTPPNNIGALDPAAANQPPLADPNGPYTGVVDVPVMFDGTGSSDPDGTIASYDWDFGDGNTGTGPQPQHTYVVDGNYTVTLTVTDNIGDSSDPVTTTATIDLANQAPTADPNGPYTGTVGIAIDFDGSGSTDPDGTIVAYDWDFGDGNTGTGVNPAYTYAGDGVFDVTLTVTDDAGATSAPVTTTATIALGNQPPVADPNGPYTGTEGVPISFDGTGSTDPDGSIASYDWDFGDGTVIPNAGPTPTHTYSAAGVYNVTLTVTDDAGVSDSAGTTADIGAGNQLPVADPNGPYTGTAGSPVTLDGSGSTDPDGTIVAYDWDFGDGNTGTGVNPTHIYAADGIYTVTLTVTDDAGDTSDPATTTASIGAVNQPPLADPNGPYTGVVDVPVMFDGTGSSDPDGTIASYDWDFGDGNTGTGPQPQHTYATSGVYDVILTVTDNAGDSSEPVTTTATIDPANQAPTADPNGPYTGTVGIAIDFDGSGSNDPDGTIVTYDWDFGDGNTGTGVNPAYTYAGDGVFDVTLTVTDDAGATSAPVTTTATIALAGNQPPVADPNGPYTGTEGVPVSFDGTGSMDPDGTIVAYDWDFGDGTVLPNAGPTPTHTYATTGLYNVTLTVTDDAGVSDSAGTTSTIEPVVHGADVLLTRLQVPNRVNARKGRTVSRNITARGDGDTITQDAMVVLSVDTPAGVEVVVTPEAVTETVSPGRPTTRFRFNADVTCTARVNGVLTWTASIDAAQNDDPTNDTLEGTTQVRCSGGRSDDDHDHDD